MSYVFRPPTYIAPRRAWIGTAAGGQLFFQSANGTLSTAGALAKQGQRVLSAVLTPTGALVRQTGKILSGTLSTAGALSAIRTVLQALTATLTMTVALVKLHSDVNVRVALPSAVVR